MIKVIDINQVEEWDSLVKSFPDYDVYYLNGYVRAFQINGDGIPMLISVSNGEYSGACVMMKRDIADDNIFEIYNLQHNKYYDLITPYGYGGLIFNTTHVPTEVINSCFDEIVDYLKKENYVSAFFRFHPVIHNAEFHIRNTEIINLGKTVAMELESEESIWKAITSKNRNVIRKAEKSGVQIKHGKGIDLLLTFKDIYDETMRHDNAEQYYYFGKGFYESIDRDLKDNYEVFYAEYEGTIISMSIIIFAGNKVNYHLSGSRLDYRHLAPTNLLLYMVALWGCEKGYKTFHLGGGLGASEDSLYKFKSAFNRFSDYHFSIGKMIINPVIYKELLRIRGLSDDKILSRISYFPQYRSKETFN